MNIAYRIFGGVITGIIYIGLVFGYSHKMKAPLKCNWCALTIRPWLVNGSIFLFDYHIHHWLIYGILMLITIWYSAWEITGFSSILTLHGLSYKDALKI